MSFKLAAAIGYRVAMRVVFWVTHERIQTVDKFFRRDMFQFFGNIVYFVPFKVQFLYQEIFPQSVFADDVKRYLFAGWGKGYTLVPGVIDQLFLGQFL